MPIDIPQMKAFGKASFEPFTMATASSSKGLQAIASETMDYTKKSFEKSRALVEKLMGVKTIDEAIKLQSDFAKSAYEDFVAQAGKIGEMYSSLAKDALTPIKAASPGQRSVVTTPSNAPGATQQS
jgi:phasin family protein